MIPGQGYDLLAGRLGRHFMDFLAGHIPAVVIAFAET